MGSLVESIKIAALEAVEAAKPCAVMFGTVASVSPLQINVEQKLKLYKEQLILTKNVTDYDIEMTVEHATEENGGTDEKHTHEYLYDGEKAKTEPGGSDMAAHKHDYKGKKLFRVHNGLKEGETVVLICMQGGQKYIVIDRIGENGDAK